MRILLILLVWLAAVLAACPARVRKPWEALPASEQALFLRALTLSMDRGYYARFVALHADEMTNREAHNSCVFLFWHRKFLLGFETMLRSLSDEFACVTLPYFDYVQHNLDYVSRKCTTIASCATILGAFGGSGPSVPSRPASQILGHRFPGSQCISASPASHFCAPGTTSCMRCVPRGPWASTYFSPDLNFNRVKQSVFAGRSMTAVTAAIEASPHDSMHATLGGAMANLFVSAADPIFFAHHATIDVLLSIYHECLSRQIGAAEAKSVSDPRVFEGCVVNNAPLTANSRVLRLASTPELPFFDNVPLTYGGWVDATQLGNSSYSYELHGLLGTLYTQCDAAGTTTNVAARRLTRHTVRHSSSGDAKAFLAWRAAIYAAATSQALAPSAIEDEVEKMMVVLYEHCLPGVVVDYPTAFKSMWRIKRPATSKALLDGITSGANPIRINDWTQINQRYYNCSGAPQA
ncbi:hypothetical protein SPRG_03900 [Saprolegnia parasitica CBS 223.65]|uniref:Tyrosinase copper-binding domain-containing protein n=1 Tax=Saprolegnia parasitica (strain CBS 223.65) TaxID=695850 RepID=A0A067CPX4_SAPPC|nr:hypothetical protein SPRG_03900 [Saprolegnia parasitica CBS 223.65]KDO31285.1 hypothetical protein SPRG_03900 [Saprolegnia parasitica CBS 223.65]|eukprot:XP_012197884.1 hypothetical protein SPRG_03900 [Saprolegnia parasitica CBS 223.65]